MNSPTVQVDPSDKPTAVAPFLHALLVVVGSIVVTVGGLLYLQLGKPPAVDAPAAVTTPSSVESQPTPSATLPSFDATESPQTLFEEPYDPQKQSIAERLHTAELLLDDYQPSEAAVQLDQLINEAEQSAQGKSLPARVFLLSGLAHEILGDTQRSQAAYQEAFRRTEKLSQRTCLALRLSTALVNQQQSPMAAGMLMSLLAKHGADLPADVRNEVLLSLAWSLAGADTTTTTVSGLLDLRHLETSSPPLSAEHILNEWDRNWSDTSLPAVRGLQVEIMQRLGSQPQEILGQARAPVMPIEDLLDALCQETKWTLRISDEARHLLRGRSGSLHTAELTLDILLDITLLPLEVEWSYDGENLHVVSIREQAGVPDRNQPGVQDIPFRRRASRYLQRAVTQASGSPRLPLLFMEIARREVLAGRYAAAAKSLEQVIALSPSGRMAACTWYNLGKLYLLADQRDAAQQAMFHAADQMEGDAVAGSAYLFAGRLLLESHAVQEAIPQLVRAITLSRGEVRGRAALLLSIAYLLNEEHASANKVLWDAQEVIALPDLNDQAAFLVAFIRHRAAQPAEREFMARQLLTAVTNLRQEQPFGDVWDVLQAMTYQDLGLLTERDQVIQRNLQTCPATASQQFLRNMLHSDGPTQMLASTSAPQDAILLQQLTQAADLERNGRTDDAIALCTELLAAQPTLDANRKQLLAILGRCYQRKGQHEDAIRCFVGMAPNP